MNKTDLISLVAEKCDFSFEEVEIIVEEFLTSIENELVKTGCVKLSNFGTFKKKVRNERTGTDPVTHERITIPESSTVVFKPSKFIKDKVND